VTDGPEEIEFDIETVMAEIKVASPEFLPFLAWTAERHEQGEVEEPEMLSVFELVYSYSRGKNEDEEERMMDGRS
jgi:hypothetical protein